MRAGLALLCVLWLGGAQAAPERFVFDTVHSRIAFKVDHLGFSQSTGWFPVFSGELLFDQQDWSASSVQVRIEVAALQMGDAAWNRKLLGRRFFDGKRHPELRFVSTRVERIDQQRGRLHGQLSLLGQTLPLSLDFVFNRRARHKYTLRDTVGFSASGQLRRSDFGMRAMTGDVGDIVHIELQVEAQRQSVRRQPRLPGRPSA